MFIPLSEYLEIISEDIEGTKTKKQAEAKKVASKLFEMSLSSIYRLCEGDAFVFIDYKNNKTRLLRTVASCTS